MKNLIMVMMMVMIVGTGCKKADMKAQIKEVVATQNNEVAQSKKVEQIQAAPVAVSVEQANSDVVKKYITASFVAEVFDNPEYAQFSMQITEYTDQNVILGIADVYPNKNAKTTNFKNKEFSFEIGKSYIIWVKNAHMGTPNYVKVMKIDASDNGLVRDFSINYVHAPDFGTDPAHANIIQTSTAGLYNIVL